MRFSAAHFPNKIPQQELPAGSANLVKRLVKSPKLYFVDTGLACHLLDMTEKQLQNKGELAGLKLLKKYLGKEFIQGILIHTGRETIPYGEDLHAVTVSTLFPVDIGYK